MKHLIWLIWCWPLTGGAQESYKGIKWTEGLNWTQVKIKAKQENRLIFLDCYATWCGPCKTMDRDVYPLDSVGDYFNDKFVSVKLQIDRTTKDSEFVESWYEDAELIRKEYRVDAFPCYLFFSPDGILVAKQKGSRSPGDFLSMARNATKPGLVYVDPNEKWIKLAEEFLCDKINIDSGYYILATLENLGEVDLSQKVTQKLYKFLKEQPFDSLFTPDRLQFISSITHKKSDRWFYLFYKYPKKVNNIMPKENRGWLRLNHAERRVVDIMLNTVVSPFLKRDMSGRMMSPPETAWKVDMAEADWIGLRKELRKQLNSYYTERILLASRFTWYDLHQNMPAFIDAYFKYLQNYGIDSHEWTSPTWLNDFAYNIFFLKIGDKAKLNKIIRYMKEVTEKWPPSYAYIDTYASLLYKVGNKEEALRMERCALGNAKENMAYGMVPFFESVIAKMEKGEKLNWEK